MAADLTMSVAVRSESNTLLGFERQLRAHLEELGIRTRFAALGATRAFLVSPADRGRPMGLVVDPRTNAAERVYLYVHVAAHVALGHNMPLITIVEGADDGTDALKHAQAERLARAIWWRGADAEAVARWLPRVRTSAVLRHLLSWRPTRWAIRSLLVGMRVGFYRFGLVRLLGDARVTGWLRQALCVAAVVSAAPQLVAPDRR